jgi:hypothetical protein
MIDPMVLLILRRRTCKCWVILALTFASGKRSWKVDLGRDCRYGG